MGFFSGLAAEKYDRQYSDKRLLKRILDYFKTQSKRLSIVGITIVFISVIEAAMPIVVSRGLDRVTQQIISSSLILTLTGIVLGLGIFSWLANFLRRRYSARTIADLIRQLATDAFQASVRQDMSFHDSFSSGKIVSRITSDTREFGQLITLSTDVLMQTITSIILSVVLIRTEWRMAFAVFLLVPLLFILVMQYRHAAREITRDGMRAMANVNATIKETVSGIAIAKNFRQEEAIYEEFQEANQTSFKVNIKRGFILSIVFPTLRAIAGIATALLVYFGAISILEGFVTAGAWYLFLTTVDRFLHPVMSVSSFFTQVQTGLSAAERIFALIDSEHSVEQKGAVFPKNLDGQINMISVEFSYTPDEKVLNIDIAATIMDYAGVEPHSSVQGRSMKPLVDGEKVGDWREEFYLEQHFDLTTTNSPHRIPPAEGLVDRRYKYMNYFKHGGAEELYDYLEDPYEKENLVNDPAYQQVLEMMKEKYEKMKIELQ